MYKLQILKVVYKFSCKLWKFEKQGILMLNHRRFLMSYKALTVKTLQNSTENTTSNHAENRCNLRQITAQSALKHTIKWMKQQGKVTEIARQEDWNEEIQALKSLQNSTEIVFSFLFGRPWKC